MYREAHGYKAEELGFNLGSQGSEPLNPTIASSWPSSSRHGPGLMVCKPQHASESPDLLAEDFGAPPPEFLI